MTLAPGSCRSCGRSGLELVLSLGRTPLANALLTAPQLLEPEETFPLDFVFCPHCALAQITETVPPEKLFRNYFYFSSFSDTVLENARVLAEGMVKRRGLGSQSKVVEIASNDGYLLANYLKAGVPVLGVEPARNVALTAVTRGIRTLPEFIDAALAKKLVSQGE